MRVAIQAGQLRHLIEIQESTEGSPIQNSFGEPIIEWLEFATVWASAGPLRGQERFVAQQVHAAQITRFTIRHLEGLTPKMRIIFDGRIYDIQSITNVHTRDRMTEIDAIERAVPDEEE